MAKKSNLTASISLRRRFTNKLMYILMLVAVVLAVVPLVFILADVFIKGAPAISLEFLTNLPTGPTSSGGGIANTIVGTLSMVGLAALIAVPIGIGAGMFFSEWPNSKLSIVAGFMNDVLTGFPTMVIGLFVYIAIVVSTKHYSSFAGAVALSFIMLPIIARTTSEALALVPMSVREASMALGIPRWKTIFRIVLSTGKTGVLTGVVLAIARATGETAPLILTAAYSTYYATDLFTQPTGSMTVLIYNYATSPYSTWITQAWGTALVLILIMLALNLVVKFGFGRSLSPVRVD